MILDIRTDGFGHIVGTQIILLLVLEEQYDQGLCCLLCHLLYFEVHVTHLMVEPLEEKNLGVQKIQNLVLLRQGKNVFTGTPPEKSLNDHKNTEGLLSITRLIIINNKILSISQLG